MTLTLQEYRQQVRKGLIARVDVAVIPHLALGLASEAGEVAGEILKGQRKGNSLDFAKLDAELGDVLWYLTALADFLGLSIEQIAEQNLRKLAKRWPATYTMPGDDPAQLPLGAKFCPPLGAMIRAPQVSPVTESPE